MESLYRCGSTGSVNNGFKGNCEFEHYFPDGDYHCPLCGHRLVRIPDGLTVSELLQQGARKAHPPSPPKKNADPDKKGEQNKK